MIKLVDLLIEVLDEKKKADRCKRIADDRYDKPSAYKSGAIVQCRTGDIWKGIDEGQSKPSEQTFKQAINDIKPLIPEISHDILHRKNMQYSEENMVKINKELLDKVYSGDEEILDKLWDLSGSSILKNAVNIITAYTAKDSLDEKESLHKWFKRKGAPGKTGGWVDCNTCREDPKTGRKKCKPCGKQKGEKRAKYPACRPTPSQCSDPGKGKTWGKTK